VDGEYPRGGSLELARLVDEYGQHLIPDLKHYYGIDLRDILSEDDPLDPGFVLIHVANLPIESAFVAAQRGGVEYRNWGQEQYTNADIHDALRDIADILIMAHRDPDKPAPKPLPRYRRPGVDAEAAITDDKRTKFKPGSLGEMMQQAKRNRRARLAAKAEAQEK
jgi:hypothetical protein